MSKTKDLPPLRDGEIIPLELVGQYTRRSFCKTALGGLALFVIPSACSDGVERVGVGSLDDPGNPAPTTGGVADSGARPPPQTLDMAVANNPPPPDMTRMQVQSNCPTGTFDTSKAASSIPIGSAVYVASQAAFLCRDAQGWYSVSASCTHEGVTLKLQNGVLHCPRHGANFTLNGSVISGPNGGPLDHYPLCLTTNNTIGLDSNSVVAASTRSQF